ncbi:MAG: hypothetical protein JWN52_2698 [Actinomycetia bacterium]|nr:hypothetical protein [Actinomycetes bacterium]
MTLWVRAQVRARIGAAVGVGMTLVLGLGVRAFLEGAFAKYAGDAFYTTLVFFLVVLAVPRVRPITAALVAIGFSWAVEFAQLTPWPAELSAKSTLFRLVLGSTFNPPDLVAYVAGAVLALAVWRWTDRLHQN